MISGITGAGVEGQAAASGTSLAGDLDAFLLLLTTQLQNQDPLSPLEPTEFTDQLVSFAAVEQAIASNKNLEDLLSLQNSTFAASVVGFIGTQISAQSNQLPLQDGAAKFTYTLNEPSANTIISITDQFGKNMLTVPGDRSGGTHDFTWDGKDAFGAQQPDGPYTVSVTAVGGNQEVIATSVVVSGKVTGISAQNGTTTLDMDGVGIGLESVITVSEPAPVTP